MRNQLDVDDDVYYHTTLGLSWCLRVLGVGGFKTVPGTVLMVAGTWLVLEDLALVQFELYRGGGEIPPPPDS